MDEDRKLLHAFLDVAVPFIEVVILLYLAPRLLVFFWPFVAAWILALITGPIVNWLEKTFHIVRRYSTMIMIIIMLGLVALVGAGVITFIVIQIVHFVQNLPSIYNSVVTQINLILADYSGILDYLPAPLINAITRITNDLGSALAVLMESIASPTFVAAQSVARQLPSVVVYIILTIIAAYCMIAEREQIRDYLYDHIVPYIPSGWKNCWECLKKEWKTVVGGYFLARFKIMSVVAVIIFIGLLFLHVQFAFWWTVLIAILDFIPVLGVGTALIPWAVYQLFVRNYRMAICLIVLYIITSTVRQIIQPKIMSDTMGLSPIKTVVLLFIGYRLFGFIGMLLSVPLGMLFFCMVDDGVFSGWTANVKKLFTLWEEQYRDRKDESTDL